MGGNITISSCGTVVAVINASGAPPGLPLQVQTQQPLYVYANLTLPYSPNDPGLNYTYQNTLGLPHKTLAVAFFNLLNEPSTFVTVDVGTALAPSASGSIAALPECLDVRDFGAVGDGVTNDTAAIQCALDQAAANWNAQQSAKAQGKPLASPGLTTVCIPAGFTFAIGGGFWGTLTCGRTWSPMNWPVNPHDVFENWVVTYLTPNSGLLNTPSATVPGGVLFVRSGVTVQLDGTLLRIPVNQFNPFWPSTVMMVVMDDQVSGTLQASDVTIQGSGIIDGNVGASTTADITLEQYGGGILAVVGKNFSCTGITIQNQAVYGMQVFAGTMVPYTFLGEPTLTTYQSSPLSNSVIKGVTFSNIGALAGVNALGYDCGGIQVVGNGVTIDGCNFGNGIGRNGIWLTGKGLNVLDCQFDNVGSVPSIPGAQFGIKMYFVDTVTIRGNQFNGGGNDVPSPPVLGGFQTVTGTCSAIAMWDNQTPLQILSNGVYQSIPPMYPIDYLYNVAITDNLINEWAGTGINQINLGLTHFYSTVRITDNTVSNCLGYGLWWQPDVWSFVYPWGNGNGKNAQITIGGRFTSNGKYASGRYPYYPINQGIDVCIGGQQMWTPGMWYCINQAGDMDYSESSPPRISCSGNGAVGGWPYYPFAYSGVTVLEAFLAWVKQPCVSRPILVVASIAGGQSRYSPNTSMLKEQLIGTVNGTNKVFSTSRPINGMIEVYQTQTSNLSASGGITINPTSITASTFLQENADFTVGPDLRTVNLVSPAITGASYYAFYETQPYQLSLTTLDGGHF